jgi:uncharacterized protein (DUF2384 family)
MVDGFKDLRKALTPFLLRNKIEERITDGLVQLLGTVEDGELWLATPNSELDDEKPLELIRFGLGNMIAEFIEDMLLGQPD